MRRQSASRCRAISTRLHSTTLSLFANKVQKLEMLSVDLAETEAPRLAALLPCVRNLNKLELMPCTALTLREGSLKKLKGLKPDNTYKGNHSAEAWPKCMSIFQKLKAPKELCLWFRNGKAWCDNAARELAELL